MRTSPLRGRLDALLDGADLLNEVGIAPFTVMLSGLALVRPTPSVAVTVKLLVAAVVGVPLIRPVDEARLSPAGSEPPVTLHV
ncbi:unannotated protein [freshwater metagenome]|uniref:Unannotated protein n=1 Tax=freshwater metagenome TaxID=449393 RepID=A0A6J7EV32_9ZZZZ